MTETITIDGVGPMPVDRPTTVAELCAIVRRCADTKTAIFPVGSGTMLDYGMPPARLGIALSTTALNQVIDYPARDLTITVQAGITMAELQATLAKENQWLPIDIPEMATIGGAIACDVSGPRRYGYGTLRDYVIGITVVNDRGEETHAGGRVVKNVAGYDFMKLHTGALGTLGVITQVTLKVKPKPETCALIAFFPFGQRTDCIQDGIDLLCRTKTCPVLSDFGWNRGIGREGQSKPSRRGWTFFVGFGGNRESVDAQVKEFRKELEGATFDYTVRPDADFVNKREIDFRVSESGSVSFKVSFALSRISAFCAKADEMAVSALHGPIGCGTLHGFFLERNPSLQALETRFQSLSEHADANESSLIIGACPPGWKTALPIWGRVPSDLALQKAVRRALDPQSLFNPGRFVTDAF